MSQKLAKQKTSARREIWRSLFSSKRALIKVVMTTLIEAVFAGLIPFAQRAFLENPSLGTILLMATVSSMQVLFLVNFYQKVGTLSAHMSRHLAMKVEMAVESTNPRHIERVGQRYGQLHSSVLSKVLYTFGNDLPNLVKDFCLVVSYLVGLYLAFGATYSLLLLGGVLLLCALLPIAVKENKRFSQMRKQLDAKVNNHLDTLIKQLNVLQETEVTWLKRWNLDQVLAAKVELYRKSELRRFIRIGIPRVFPTWICNVIILSLAVQDHRTTAELSIIMFFVHSTMMIAYGALELFTNLADSQGDVDQLDETLRAPTRPEGSGCIERIDGLALSGDLQVHFTENGKITGVLFRNGLLGLLGKTELVIPRGAFVTLVGERGAGKSHLADLLVRQLDNTKGDEVEYSGKYQLVMGEQRVDVSATRLSDFRQRWYYCPQVARWVDGIKPETREEIYKPWVPGTVYQNLELVLHRRSRHQDLSASGRERIIRRAAEAVELDHKLDQVVEKLSGGEKISCMLGRALVGPLLGPSWLVMDETFSQLELTMAKRLLANTREILKETNSTGIMISHMRELDPDDAIVWVLGPDGQGIVEVGQVANLKQRKDSAYAQMLVA